MLEASWLPSFFESVAQFCSQAFEDTATWTAILSDNNAFSVCACTNYQKCTCVMQKER